MCVPQAIDERIEQKRYHSVQDGHHLAEVQSVGLGGCEVHEDAAAIRDRHHHQVRHIGGKGFLSASHRGDFDHSSNDVDVGYSCNS